MPMPHSSRPAFHSGRFRTAFATALGLGILAASVLASSSSRAEILTLADNTQVMGKLLHFYDGIIAIETTGGQKLELPKEKVQKITFKLPPPRAEFSSPE
jgi:hypothetical protein